MFFGVDELEHKRHAICQPFTHSTDSSMNTHIPDLFHVIPVSHNPMLREGKGGTKVRPCLAIPIPVVDCFAVTTARKQKLAVGMDLDKANTKLWQLLPYLNGVSNV